MPFVFVISFKKAPVYVYKNKIQITSLSDPKLQSLIAHASGLKIIDSLSGPTPTQRIGIPVKKEMTRHCFDKF